MYLERLIESISLILAKLLVTRRPAESLIPVRVESETQYNTMGHYDRF